MTDPVAFVYSSRVACHDYWQLPLHTDMERVCGHGKVCCALPASTKVSRVSAWHFGPAFPPQPWLQQAMAVVRMGLELPDPPLLLFSSSDICCPLILARFSVAELMLAVTANTASST